MSSSILKACLALLTTGCVTPAWCGPAIPNRKPIMLDRSGGFTIGGRVVSAPNSPSQTLHCDHGYAEYFIPTTPRHTSLVMWHSSSTQSWQNRWDGGEGFKDIFLRRDYPVYLWDGPRIGRANWGCEGNTYVPSYRDQSNFLGWNFGPRYLQFWPGSQFPADNKEAWDQATSARVAGLRALRAATKVVSNKVKGLVLYESMGFVYPDNVGVPPQAGGFGPLLVSEEEFRRLAKIPLIQFIWGDHRTYSDPKVEQTRLCAALINAYGGNARVMLLGEEPGMDKGNTHIPFADMNNEQVADLLERGFQDHGLDGFVDDAKNNCEGSAPSC